MIEMSKFYYLWQDARSVQNQALIWFMFLAILLVYMAYSERWVNHLSAFFILLFMLVIGAGAIGAEQTPGTVIIGVFALIGSYLSVLTGLIEWINAGKGAQHETNI